MSKDLLSARETFRAQLGLSAPGSTSRPSALVGPQSTSSRSAAEGLGDYTGRVPTGRAPTGRDATGGASARSQAPLELSSFSTSRLEELSTARAEDLLASLKAERQQRVRRLKSVEEEIGSSGEERGDGVGGGGGTGVFAGGHVRDPVIKSRKPMFLKAPKSIKPWGPKILPKNNKGGHH